MRKLPQQTKSGIKSETLETFYNGLRLYPALPLEHTHSLPQTQGGTSEYGRPPTQILCTLILYDGDTCGVVFREMAGGGGGGVSERAFVPGKCATRRMAQSTGRKKVHGASGTTATRGDE